jgi:hypothetical protein
MSANTRQLARALLEHHRARHPRKPPEEVPPPTVAQWLERATAAHLDYRQALRNGAAPGHRVIPPALEEAARCRAEAELLDPDHADPAWSLSGATHSFANAAHEEYHEPLLRFYARELGIEEPPPISGTPHPEHPIFLPEPEPSPIILPSSPEPKGGQ